MLIYAKTCHEPRRSINYLIFFLTISNANANALATFEFVYLHYPSLSYGDDERAAHGADLNEKATRSGRHSSDCSWPMWASKCWPALDSDSSPDSSDMRSLAGTMWSVADLESCC